MRLALSAAAVCVAMLFAGGIDAAPASPFLGTWWATDPSDGSLEQLTFGAGGSMFFRDDLASNPACGGTAAIAQDTGTVSGNTWTGSGQSTLYCQGGGQVPDVFFQFTLDPDGTLSGSIGAEVWTRARPATAAAVSIDLFPTQFCCPQEIGTWHATGAINDSGSYVRTGGRSTGSFDHQTFCQPDHTAAFSEVFLLSGSQGTVTVKAEELVIPTGELCPPSVGVWQVVSGTGAYAGIGGHGTSQFFKTPVADLALSGVVVSQAN